MKRFLCVIGVISTLFLFCTGCSTKNNNGSVEGANTASGKNTNANSSSNTSSGTNDSVELEKNLVTSGAVTKKGKLVVFVTNNNKIAVDYEIEAEFYDKDGNIVGSDKENVDCAGANSEIAIELWSTPERFDTYQIYVDVEATDNIPYYDKIEIKHNNTKRHVAIQVKNNSNDTIEYMDVSVVYYKDGVVVGYNEDSAYDVKSGRSGNFEVSHPTDRDYDDIKYDTYKVFVNNAYTYDW